ncbi:MAG: pyridoxal phosphate-dependent aminotransferase [Candidatus Polarisedimenticolia bacterium]
MTEDRLSRRGFARTLGASLGAALVPLPALAREAVAATEGATAATGEPGKAPAAIRLDSNENPYGPSPRARSALKRAPEIAARYPDAREDRLIEVLAERHGVAPEQIVLGCGSGEILKMADMAFLGPGKCVVAADPTFEAVLLYARATRADAVRVPLTEDFRHDLPALAAACPENAGLIYVCNPNNPTATIVGREEMTAFLPRIPRGTIVLVDEAYHHFVFDDRYRSALESLPEHPNLLVVRTFSKIYGLAGMRLGYGVAARPVIAALREHRIWSNTNAAVLEAAIASLEEPDHVAAQRRANAGTRDRLRRALEAEGRRTIPSHANFLMIDLGTDVGPVIEAFRARGLQVGRRFATLPHWLRISIGTPREMDAFHAALRVIVPAGAETACGPRPTAYT